MKNIDLAALSTGTGGVFNECINLDNKKPTTLSQQDLAILATHCGVKMPTKTQLENAKHIMFMTGPQ